VLLSMPLKRLVLCKSKRIVARWLKRESFWNGIESLDANPGIGDNLSATRFEDELVPSESGEEDWRDTDVEDLCDLLDLSSHEERVLRAHLELHQECKDEHIKFSTKGYRRKLADKLSDYESQVTVHYVARHLKSVRAKCREFLGGTRRRFTNDGDSDGPPNQEGLERGSSGFRPEDLARSVPWEGGSEQ